MTSSDELRHRLAVFAVDKYVRNNMTIGLGTGRMASAMIHVICTRMLNGELSDLSFYATSNASRSLVVSYGLEVLCPNNLRGYVDITLDGADEVDANKNLIKGRGAALFQEKWLESRSKTLIIMCEHEKVAERLGSGALPVEIARHGYQGTLEEITRVVGNCNVSMMMNSDNEILITDNGNYVAQIYFESNLPGTTSELVELNKSLKMIVGVLETGLFISMADVIVSIDEQGVIRYF